MMKLKVKKLSVIIPAYNESSTIKKLLVEVKKVNIGSIKKEIIVVDDGSRDNTTEIVSKISGVKILKKKKNAGKGAAIRDGIRLATGEIIIIQDADLEYNPNEYPKLIQPIIDGREKIVYGSRFLADIQKKKNVLFLRKHNKSYSMAYIGGRLITHATNILFNANITDEPTCYKVFDAKTIKSIKFRGNRFEWEPEITAKICKRGFKIYEVPITYRPRTFEEGKKIGWKDGLQAIWTLIKFRFID